MKSRNVLSNLIAVTILLAFMSGCSKKEDTSTVEDETAPESSIQATETKSARPSISPVMDQFLKKTVGTKNASAGYQISEFFSFWEEILHHPRISMNIYFEVDIDEPFQRDHTWKNKTNREILDELCKEYNLTWTITEPDTIQITKKP